MMNKFRAILLLGGWLFAISCSATPSSQTDGCLRALLPYQYGVITADDYYFATLRPLDAQAGEQEFFMAQTLEPLRDETALEGGDPAGEFIMFERVDESVIVPELGLSWQAQQPDSDVSEGFLFDPKRGVTQFQHDDVRYMLVSCDGIFSEAFMIDFPALFD